VEVSIVEHGDTAFLGLRSDICVERKNLKGIFRKLDLSESRVMAGKKCYHLKEKKPLRMLRA
jgi:hypothetical protein